MTKVRTYPRRGLHGAVVHDIGLRIVSGELKPGDPLPGEDETNEPSVSRTVLREAIKVLAAKRLVESRPKTGTRVRPRDDWNLIDPDVLAWQLEAGPTRRFVLDTLELRRIVEPAAARLAAERATEEDLDALQAAVEEMEAAADDREAFVAPDVRFHSLILEACRNELLQHMANVVGSVLQALLAFTAAGGPPDALARATRLHGAILDAIRSRDGSAAEAAVHALLDDTTANVEWVLRERRFGSA